MTQEESETEIRRLTETLDELLEHVGAVHLDEAVEKLAAERAAHEHDAGTINRLRRERDEARAEASEAVARCARAARGDVMQDETRTTKVHRIEVLVIDFDDLGPEEVCEVLENARYPNRCIRPEAKRVETREVEWSDEHPLNRSDTADAAYRELFGIEET